MKIDKTNGNVKYNDEHHVYWDEDGKYVSVTTLIGHYKNKFDQDFWSKYKALEAIYPVVFNKFKDQMLTTRKIPVEEFERHNVLVDLFEIKAKEISDSYDKTRIDACERGTKIHAEFENAFYTKKTHELSEYGLGGKFKCEPNYYELDSKKGVYPEYLISLTSSDGLLKVAGQIDLLIKDGNDIIIVDYKTNKKLDHKSFYNKRTKKNEVLKYPVHNIQDCNVMHYTLQLSLYAYLLQVINPEFNIKKLMIIHIDHDGKRTDLELEYKKDDIIRLLNHYKNNVLIQDKLDKDKPIQY